MGGVAEVKYYMSKSKQELGDGLVIKTAEDQDDIERVAQFDNIVFDEKVGTLCRQLFTNHPNVQPSDLIFVEDENNGEIVSTLCLIPWEWKYEEVTLNVGEMGIVGTLEPYRSRGLIRSQADHHKNLLNDRGFDISIIQGIPYFYRQFGYEYSIPLERRIIIEPHQIPMPAKDEKPSYICRPASSNDLPEIEIMYNESAKSLAIHTLRSKAIWQYLVENNPKTCTASEMWIVSGQTTGYFFIQNDSFGYFTVNEVSKLSYDASIAVLRHLKELAVERNKPNIRLNLPANCELAKVALYHGAFDHGAYAWQIYIPNVVRFLRKIAPVLEHRISESPFAGLTEDIRITFYTEKIIIHFENGRIIDIEGLGFSSEWGEPIQIPTRAAVPLFLGCRDREESQVFWKDMGAQPKYAYLLDVLFPKMESFIYSIY
jgi:predicted N-acetyltransferase YhbS